MSVFKFVNIRAEVRRVGPSEEEGLDTYAVTLRDPDGNWIEVRSTAPRGEARTTADEFDLAYGALQSMYVAAENPGIWKAGYRGDASELELDTTIAAAQRMIEWFGPAVENAESRWELYQEGREEGVGPLEISGR